MKPKKGRGAQINLPNQYESFHIEENPDKDVEFKKIHPKEILSKVKSPDVGFEFSLNPYLGCEHGCVYCYARNSHNYWGYNAGISFERNILYKENAADLLRKKFDKKSWKPSVIALSGNTDCYQPVERKMKITRRVLEVCLKYRNPVSIITKNILILRDLDILTSMAERNLVVVRISITTRNEELRRSLEPRTSSYKQRLKAVSTLARANVPVIGMIAPIIPGLNDFEVSHIMKDISEAGAWDVNRTVVRLNGQIAEVFTDWIHKAFPLKAGKVLNLIKQCHQGKLNDSRWHLRMRGDGVYAEMLRKTFELYRKKYFPYPKKVVLRRDLFRRPYERSLWEDLE